MYNHYLNKLRQLEQESNLRRLPREVSPHCINLSSNDYLGLNADEHLKQEFLDSIRERNIKFSATSSRLLTGNCAPYENLESLIAEAYQRKSCLIFNSGYHANVGILSCLAGKNDLIVADKHVHASILDGIRLSQAKTIRYKHLDYHHLENILKTHRNQYENAFIVTESIFSMDGNLSDLHRLVELKKEFRCFLYIDEAHAFGVYGSKGLGLAEHLGCTSECDFIVGTFGKALASLGAFVVCDSTIKQYLINHSRSFIFTTALPAINLMWTSFLFERLAAFEEKRKHLENLGKSLSTRLGQPHHSHIVPYLVGNNEKAVRLSSRLQEAGIHVLPIRYPTVPENQAQLRFSLNASLTWSQLEPIPDTLKQWEALEKISNPQTILQ